MDPEDIAAGLERSEIGYWTSRIADEVSYPPEGSTFCMLVEDRSFWLAHRNRAIVAAVGRFPPAAGPVFDVGAGNGFVSAAIAETGVEVVSIEPDPVGAANAVKRGLRSVICGTFPSSQFHRQVAGAIALFDVIEHVADDVQFLASMAPHLKAGGRVYVTVPAHRWLWSDSDLSTGHKRRYTRSSVRKALESAGYDVEYVTYIFWWLPLPILLFRAIPAMVRRRKPRESSPSVSQHTAGSKALRKWLEASLDFEVSRISNGRSVPFGATCLAVARLP